MTVSSLDALVRALEEGDIRYLIVGGLAVVAHGFVRFTADVDVIVDLEPTNLRKALTAVAKLGYIPRAPVPLLDFLDPVNRARWIHEKNMTVFSLHSPMHPATEIDLFTQIPLDFEAAYGRRVRMEIAPGLKATFVGLDDLLTLKRQAGRAVDHLDIRQLEAIREAKRDE